MAPNRNNTNGMNRDDTFCGIKVDRKIRKPLVEKKRRARINESLHELRVLIADTDLQSKIENAEVLEMTVKRVESILQSQEKDVLHQEACERFAAGYIQCMHEVHTFVSNCPGIDPAVAAELLNHLLESMPLNHEDRLQAMLTEIVAEYGPGGTSTWPLSESMFTALGSPGGASLSSSLSPAPSISSSDDLGSDLDETDSEQSSFSVDEVDNQNVLCSPSLTYSTSVWRPW